jgi:hypothetical protein
MPLKLHDKEYDETLRLFVRNEQNGHQIITDNSFIVSTITNKEFRTTRYGEFDIIHDFSELALIDKSIMKKE